MKRRTPAAARHCAGSDGVVRRGAVPRPAGYPGEGGRRLLPYREPAPAGHAGSNATGFPVFLEHLARQKQGRVRNGLMFQPGLDRVSAIIASVLRPCPACPRNFRKRLALRVLPAGNSSILPSAIWRKLTWLPGFKPSRSRTGFGMVTCPLAVTVVLNDSTSVRNNIS